MRAHGADPDPHAEVLLIAEAERAAMRLQIAP
jgi:hypothetical protein